MVPTSEPPRPAPSTIVFDVGNVLVDWDPRHLYRKVFSGDEAKMTWFLSNVITGAWNVELDRGRSYVDGIAMAVAAHPEWEAEIRAFDERWHEMIPGEIADTVALLADVQAAGYPTYAITNYSREKWAESIVRFPFLTSFAGVIVSAHERIIKPDPAIFQLFETRYGVALTDCLFIDDSPRNVATARDLGMRAIQYVRGMDLRAELAAHGVVVPVSRGS